MYNSSRASRFNGAQYFGHYKKYMYRLKVLEEENSVDCAKVQKVLWINGREHAKIPNDEKPHVVFTPGMSNATLEAELAAIAEQEAVLDPHDPMSAQPSLLFSYIATIVLHAVVPTYVPH
ncbi:hypothetical protein BU17DRAFT_70784 [Hysterangium stoloniferum]|nr:hypothetical protein BU17DRAFT_70784 [Hysterangium stoloniferum]